MTIIHSSWLRFQILMERWQGLDFTRCNLHPSDLGLNDDEVAIPAPSGDRFLVRVFEEMGIQPSDNVLDIGCAKGSALRRLSQFPFTRAEGLELASELAAIACHNFARLQRPQVKIHCLDARSFTGFNDFNFFYLYNPFSNPILEGVLKSLTAQVDAGRERIVVYNNPIGHALMLQHGFAPMRRYPDFWGHGIVVYSNRPAQSRLGAARPVTVSASGVSA